MTLFFEDEEYVPSLTNRDVQAILKTRSYIDNARWESEALDKAFNKLPLIILNAFPASEYKKFFNLDIIWTNLQLNHLWRTATERIASIGADGSPESTDSVV